MSHLGYAILWAAQAHKDQKDKLGKPYILHSIAVMSQMQTDDEKIVAVLHDVFEDTDAEIDLMTRFNKDVQSALMTITKKKAENYTDYIHRVKSNKIATKVKIADLRDNLDPSRLIALDTAVRNRLINKYKKALDILSEGTTDDQ